MRVMGGDAAANNGAWGGDTSTRYCRQKRALQQAVVVSRRYMLNNESIDDALTAWCVHETVL
jgi:hypothetical protein